MRNMFWLGLFEIVTMGVAGIAQAASDDVAPLRVAAADEAQASVVSATGVVRQVKPEAGKVKISHDPIPALDWPAMTMDFRVKDKTVLQGIGPGSKVRFELEKDAKGLAITRMERVTQ